MRDVENREQFIDEFLKFSKQVGNYFEKENEWMFKTKVELDFELHKRNIEPIKEWIIQNRNYFDKNNIEEMPYIRKAEMLLSYLYKL